MNKLLMAGLLLLSIGLPTAMRAAPVRADGPPVTAAFGDSDDPAVALVDLLASMADCLAAYQDHIANEAYLGSAAPARRLRTAVSWAPAVIIPERAAQPLSSCLILLRRDDD